MSSGINKVILVGNLGRDPEVKFLESGNAVCNLSVACTERRKDGDSWKDHVEWVRVTAFGKTAENAGQYLSKGRQVYVEGRLQTREYEKDGEKRFSTEVVANQLLFLGGNGDGAKQATSGSTNGSTSGGRQAARPAAQPEATGFADDDLPF